MPRSKERNGTEAPRPLWVAFELVRREHHSRLYRSNPCLSHSAKAPPLVAPVVYLNSSELSRGKRKIFYGRSPDAKSKNRPHPNRVQSVTSLRTTHLPSTYLPHTNPLPIAHPAHPTQIRPRSKVWEKYGSKKKTPRKPHHSTISGAVVELRGVAEVNLITPDHAFFVPESVKTGQNVALAVSLKHN